MVRLKKTKREQKHRERGQSLVELGLLVPLLVFLIVGVIEMTQAFTVYIALISATRAGATQASLFPELRNCADPPASDTSAISTKCIEYSERVKDEILAMREFGFAFMDPAELDIDVPVMYSPSGSTVYANCPITSTLTYRLHTIFTSNISIPFIGRAGLPSAYSIRYSNSAPIREAEQQHAACLTYP